MSDIDREPVAWLAFATDGRDDLAELFFSAADAEKAAVAWGGRVTPLFFAPTLTDEEREAVASAIRWCEIDAPADGDIVSRYCAARAATLRGLLERTDTGEK